MEYRYLGRTGLKVSELCLGTMTFGRDSDEPTSHQIFDRFVEAGGNFVDTADVYGRGVSEEVVGHWLKGKPRDSLVLATKVRHPMGSGPNEEGLSRKHIVASVDASLRRLGTDYVDLYQAHSWDGGAPLEETLGAFNRLVETGKVRYLGTSNFTGWQLQKAVDLSRQMGWEPFSCLQSLYNLLDRGIEWELLPVCEREGLGVIAWSPLRGGWLSGKFRRGMAEPPAGTRISLAEEHGWGERWSIYNTERTWSVLDALFDVAADVGKTPAQVALNWLLRKPAMTAPIVGARTLAQLEENLGAVGWCLADEQVARLDEASLVPPPYPYGGSDPRAHRPR